VLCWIFQEFFPGKLFSSEEGVVCQTGSGTACCLSVVGLGVLGAFVSAQPLRNPSAHNGGVPLHHSVCGASFRRALQRKQELVHALR